MKKYKIKLETSVLQDIEQSYVWGCKQWGVEQAQKWYRSAKETIRNLAVFPERLPIAPEAKDTTEFQEEIRQMVFQRYRILFTVKGNTVHVLHLRGAYKGSANNEEETEAEK